MVFSHFFSDGQVVGTAGDVFWVVGAYVKLTTTRYPALSHPSPDPLPALAHAWREAFLHLGHHSAYSVPGPRLHAYALRSQKSPST